MKLIDSGVTFSAAMQRSPSFSRSSSSTMITTWPRRYSSAASSMVAKGMRDCRGCGGRRRATPYSLSGNLETLLHRVRLLRHGVDDLHLQRVVARLERRLDLGQRNRAEDRVMARAGRARERQWRGIGQRRADRLL